MRVVSLLRIDPFYYFPVQSCVKAPRLDKAPVPLRSRLIPFKDETSDVMSTGNASLALGIGLLGVAALVAVSLR